MPKASIRINPVASEYNLSRIICQIMSQRSFYLQLALISGFAAVGLFLINRLPVFHAYSDLSWISLAFFVGLSIAMFYTGHRAAFSSNKHNFTNTVLGFTIGKIFLSVIIILLYFKLAEPETKFFILPFFGVYLIFTIFESYFMTRLGKMN